MEHEYCGSWESAVVVAFIKVNSGLLTHFYLRPSPWPHGAYGWVGLRALFSCVTEVFYFLRLLKEEAETLRNLSIKETVLCRPRRMSCFLRRTGKWGMREAARPQNTVLSLRAPLLDAHTHSQECFQTGALGVCVSFLWTLHREPELCTLGAQGRMKGSGGMQAKDSENGD